MEPVDQTTTASTADLLTTAQYNATSGEAQIHPNTGSVSTSHDTHTAKDTGHAQEIEINLSPEPGENDVKVIVEETTTTPQAEDLDEKIEKTIQFAIKTAIGCCIPLGLLAMYFAYKAKRLSKSGRKQEAEDTDLLATKIALSSCCFGMLLYIAVISVIIYFQT